MAQRIRIRLKAYDHDVIDKSAADIVRTAENDRRSGVGADPAAHEAERWTVLRSPHVDKKSREQFETARAQAADRHPRLDARRRSTR